MKCEGCGLPTGTVFQSAYGKLLAKPSANRRCVTCRTLIRLKMHPKLKS